MVRVANDAALSGRELPTERDVSGISLGLIAGLAATAHGSVRAPAPRLDVSVDGTMPLLAAVREADAGVSLVHRLVLADAAALAEHEGDPGDVVRSLWKAGAAAVVMSGVEEAGATRLREVAEDTGLPLLEVPLD